jgi:hypothetical protein
MGKHTRTGKQLAEAKAEEKRKELQTLTENLISKYQGKAYGVTVSKEKQISVRFSCVL